MPRCCPKHLIKFFKAVCDEPRQEIIALLRDKGSLNASTIIKHVELSQPTISHHLKILIEAEIITSKKQGKEVIYTLSEDYVSDCCSGVMKWFCKKSKK